MDEIDETDPLRFDLAELLELLDDDDDDDDDELDNRRSSRLTAPLSAFTKINEHIPLKKLIYRIYWRCGVQIHPVFILIRSEHVEYLEDNEQMTTKHVDPF